MSKLEETLLVSFSFSETDIGVAIVGRKRPNKSIEIVNAFSGKEALELYKNLTNKREANDDKT